MYANGTIEPFDLIDIACSVCRETGLPIDRDGLCVDCSPSVYCGRCDSFGPETGWDRESNDMCASCAAEFERAHALDEAYSRAFQDLFPAEEPDEGVENVYEGGYFPW